MTISITETQFTEAVIAAQDEWTKVMGDDDTCMGDLVNLLHNLAFASMIQKQLFKDGQEDK